MLSRLSQNDQTVLLDLLDRRITALGENNDDT